MTGTVKSAIGLGSLLWMGIGDTIRVSLSADPVEEVRVGFEILKALGLRHRGVNIISCPSCARQGFDVIRTVEILEKRLEHVKTPMSLSIIGCVVNGPGEALMTDVGFTGGGAGAGMVYMAGKQHHKLGQRPHGRPHRRAGREAGRRARGRARGGAEGGGVAACRLFHPSRDCRRRVDGGAEWWRSRRSRLSGAVGKQQQRQVFP